MALRKIGEAVTGTNGKCVIPYTGVGVGRLQMRGQYEEDGRVIQSETYSIYDTQFYDKALEGSGNHNDNYNNITNLSRASDGTTFNMPSAWTQLMPKINNSVNISLNDGLCVEFDILALDNQGGQIRFTVYDGSNRVTLLSDTGHYKAVITDDIKIYKDNNPNPINTLDLNKSSGYVQLIFTNNTANASLKFKDYLIYPI